eukprot:6199197-Pleurochrysis_carterae.AAC.1
MWHLVRVLAGQDGRVIGCYGGKEQGSVRKSGQLSRAKNAGRATKLQTWRSLKRAKARARRVGASPFVCAFVRVRVRLRMCACVCMCACARASRIRVRVAVRHPSAQRSLAHAARVCVCVRRVRRRGLSEWRAHRGGAVGLAPQGAPRPASARHARPRRHAAAAPVLGVGPRPAAVRARPLARPPPPSAASYLLIGSSELFFLPAAFYKSPSCLTRPSLRLLSLHVFLCWVVSGHSRVLHVHAHYA